MCKVICMVNIKGGVGKTVSTVNMAVCLSKSSRVLIIDLDPQANATQYLNRYDKSGEQLSTYDVLMNKKVNMHDVIVNTDIENVDIVPSNIKLALCVDAILIDTERSRENRLRKALEAVESEYDYIFIDSPPFLSILTTNALVASDYVLVPIKIDLFALDGFTYLLDKIEKIKDEFNPKLKLLGAFITIFEKTRTSREVSEYLKSQLGNMLFNTHIRKNAALIDSTFSQKPVVVFDKNANASIDYLNLVEEVFNND